jgi:protein-tyrosine phosphatase
VWRIDTRLYLGDYPAGVSALTGAELPTEPDGELAPFAAVVSLCPMPLLSSEPIDEPTSEQTEWLRVPIRDGGNGEDEFEQALAVALPFIERARERGNVLVHCAAGMSRSVSVIAAILCEAGTAVDAAYERIAAAKADALGPFGVETDLLICPAMEFRSCLLRRYRR